MSKLLPSVNCGALDVIERLSLSSHLFVLDKFSLTNAITIFLLHIPWFPCMHVATWSTVSICRWCCCLTPSLLWDVFSRVCVITCVITASYVIVLASLLVMHAPALVRPCWLHLKGEDINGLVNLLTGLSGVPLSYPLIKMTILYHQSKHWMVSPQCHVNTLQIPCSGESGSAEGTYKEV